MSDYDKKEYGDQYTHQSGAAADVAALPAADYSSEPYEIKVGLKRQLKSRHIAMISIGGVIGTGLFLGPGGALANGGPLGLFMGYAFMGSICYSVMISLGEMIAYLPIPGGHIRLAERFVDPALSFAMGWNYWYNWLIIMPAELAAAAVLINYWNATINNALWISICFLVVIVINFLGAGVYGECEFWFASIKVITITGLIILGIIITSGGGPNHEKIGFRYWRNPGAFTQFNGFPGTKGRFLGFWAVMTQAAFSYIGTEIVAIAAGEAKNPRRNIPRAIKRVYVRILVFYLIGTFVIGLIVPSNLPELKLGSGTLGIPALPSIINACLLTSAWSAASSDLFTSSRALYGLALTHNAPRIFARTTAKGLPYVSLIVCAAFGALAYMSLESNAGKVFNYLANLTATAGLLTWWGICFTYLRFRKGCIEQGLDRKILPYWGYANAGGAAAWYAIVFISVILFFSGYTVFFTGAWSAADFITNYLPVMMFPVLWIGYKLIRRTKMVRKEEMDFYTGIEEIEAESYDEPPSKNLLEKIWRSIM